MTEPGLRVLVTGAHGFIGKNLDVRLRETGNFTVVPFLRDDDPRALPGIVADVDAVVHLAGENRPADETAFKEVNFGLTAQLCEAIANEIVATGRQLPIIYSSSTQVTQTNAYGKSKLAGEQAIRALSEETENPATIFRLPGVFGKWCRPNYNSVVATFCYNVAHGLPLRINDPTAPLSLVYVDDVVTAFLKRLRSSEKGVRFGEVRPQYETTVGELAEQIRTFEDGRTELRVERVGSGLTRALYATYIAALPFDRFSYIAPAHRDARGTFVEMLKTPDSGQFSFLTAPPGVTRGGHYHHTKVEKFLVIQGEALFRYRHLLTDERVELRTSGDQPQVVETIPGWAHDITNVGEDDMIVMLWANEVFDPNNPDTISSKV